MSDGLMATLSRREFLTRAGYLGAGYSLASAFPFPALSCSLADDPRISQTPVVDAGFASVRKIGDGSYATISDPSKGLSTMCNGGFLFGRDAVLLVEGFVTAAGAAFQMDTLRKVSQVPAVGALDTHYHYDHSLGNAFYGANGMQLWGHASLPQRITESYGAMQATERSTFLAPFEKRVNEAKSEAQKQHADGDLGMYGNIFDFVKKSPLTLPYAAKKTCSACATSLMTCPSKPQKCTKRECPQLRPGTNMSFRKNIRALPCFPGASVFAPLFQSFTPSCRTNRRRTCRRIGVARPPAALPVMRFAYTAN